MPGIAASTKLTLELGGRPNSVDEPENSFDSDVTWACTSMPMMISQSPVDPLMKLLGFGVRVSMMVKAAELPKKLRSARREEKYIQRQRPPRRPLPQAGQPRSFSLRSY